MAALVNRSGVVCKPSSNGARADGTSMNVGNRLGSRPTIRLLNKDNGDAMRSALSDEAMGLVSENEQPQKRNRGRHRSLPISDTAPPLVPTSSNLSHQNAAQSNTRAPLKVPKGTLQNAGHDVRDRMQEHNGQTTREDMAEIEKHLVLLKKAERDVSNLLRLKKEQASKQAQPQVLAHRNSLPSVTPIPAERTSPVEEPIKMSSEEALRRHELKKKARQQASDYWANQLKPFKPL